MVRRIPGRSAVLLAVFGAAWSVGPAELAAQDPTITLDSLLAVRISAASRYEQTASRAPASVTIVTAEDIERFGYRTLDEVLEAVRGFYVSNDRNYSYVGVRGFSRPTDYNNRLVVLLNGQTLNETFYNSTSGNTGLGIDLAAVDRIEIVRGPASAMYGTSAMLAVIDIVTKSAAQLEGGSARLDLGTAGSVQAAAISGAVLGPVDVAFAVAGGRTDGPDLRFPELADSATDGTARGLDWERFENALATVRAGDLVIQARAASRRKGIPTGAWDTNFGDDRTRTLDEWYGLAGAYARRMTPRLAWSLSAHVNRYHYSGAYAADVVYRDRNVGVWGGLGGQAIWDLAPGHRVTAGADLNHTVRAEYENGGAGEIVFGGDFPYSTWSLYATDELQLGSTILVTGALRADGHSETSLHLSPRLGLIVAPSPATTVKLLWGRAFRMPTVYEREYHDEWTFTRAGDLRPERIQTAELVVEQRLGGPLRLTISAFDDRIADLIDAVDDEATGRSRFANAGRAHARGLEAELGLRHRSGATAYVVGGYLRAADGYGERLTNSPRLSAKAGGAAPTPFGVLGFEARFEDERRTLLGTDTDPALVVNGSFTSRPLFGGVRLTARVRDLFDSGFAVPGGVEHRQASIPQGPRSFSIGLNVDWR